MRATSGVSFLILLIVVPVLLFADNEIIEKKDGDFKLTGLIPSSSGGVAIINNHTYQVGELVGGYIVVGIFNNYVELKKDGVIVQLKLCDEKNLEKQSNELIWKGIGKRGYKSTRINLNDQENSRFDVAHVNALWAPLEKDDGTSVIDIVCLGSKTRLQYDSFSIANQDCDNLLVELNKKKKWELREVLSSVQNSENKIEKLREERQKWLDRMSAEHKKCLIKQARAKYLREMKRAREMRRIEEAQARYRAKRDAKKNLRGIPVIATGPIIYSPEKVQKLTTEQKEWLLIQQCAQQKYLNKMRELQEIEDQEKWMRNQEKLIRSQDPW